MKSFWKYYDYNISKVEFGAWIFYTHDGRNFELWSSEKAQYISHSGSRSSTQDFWTHMWPSTVIILVLKWLQQQLCIVGKFSHFEYALYGITPSIAILAVQNLFRSLELFFFEKSIITLKAWKSSVGISKWQWTLPTDLREDLQTINLKFNTIKISLAFRFQNSYHKV